MGTRKSKHNRGRKPLYKEISRQEVIDRKRAHLFAIDNDSNDNEYGDDLSNDIPILSPITQGNIKSEKVTLGKKPDKSVTLPKSLLINSDQEPIHGSNRGIAAPSKKRGYIVSMARHMQDISKYAKPQTIRLASRSKPITYKGNHVSAAKLNHALNGNHWNKIGRYHYLCALFSVNGGMPEWLSEIPMDDLLIILEEMDFNEVTNRWLKLQKGENRETT